MNALGNMKALSDALDPNSRERLQSPELWTRLEVYRAAATSSLNGQLGEPECTKMASGLLKGIELRILFIAVDYAHQHGDETKRRAIGYVLVFIFASSMGPDLYENDAEVVPFFLAGLGHPIPAVRKLTTKIIVALGHGNAGGRQECCRKILQPPLLPALVAVLGDSDTGAAQAVGDALVKLCEISSSSESGTVSSGPVVSGATATGAETGLVGRRAVMAMLVSQLGEILSGLTDRDAATPKLRFADTAARLMSSSEIAFREAVETGAVSLVTSLTGDSSDVLLQLNALDLLEQVASSVSGAKYIAEDGQLLGLLAAAGGGEGEQSAPPNPLLGASALRTLGKVLAKAARVDLEIDYSMLRGFLRACTAHIEVQDESSKVAGMMAASSLAEVSATALREMLGNEQGSGGVLDVWLVLSRHKVDEKAAALHSMARVLGPPPSTPETGGGQYQDLVMGNTDAGDARDKRSSLMKQFFDRLGSCNGQSTGALLVGLVRQPVPEVRHAAYDVLRCTMWQPGGWGLQAILSQPGFREFLEDRDVQNSKASKEWKFSVVESVMQCQERGILGQNMLDSFHKILKEGPFWVPAKTRDVATMS